MSYQCKSAKLFHTIAFRRLYVEFTGSVTAALLLSQAEYWSSRSKNGDGWFFKSQSDWQKETGLSRCEQESARKKLRDTGLLAEEKRGMPARIFFRANGEKIDALTDEAQVAGNQQPRMLETSTQVAGNQQPRMLETSNLPYIAKTYTETTNKEIVSLEAEPKKKEASEYQRFIEGWSASYQRQTGERYQFEGGRDGKAAKALLASGLTAEQLINRVQDARVIASEAKNGSAWNCQNRCDTIHDFQSAFNKITAEIVRHKGGGQNSSTRLEAALGFKIDGWKRRVEA